MIVITGASEGLGKELAKIFKKKGYRVLNISRNESAEADENLRADLSVDADIKRVIDTLNNSKEKIEALVHNAGVLSLGPTPSLTIEEYDRVMDVNLRAPVLITSGIFDRIVKDEADVINIASTASLQTGAERMIYNVSKVGFKGFTDNLRTEFEPYKSRVIGVYPGMLDTDMAAHIPHPLPKSKYKTINPTKLAELIVAAFEMPQVSEVSDIVIERKRSV